MTPGRRSFLAFALCLMLPGAAAHAASPAPWDGVWKGSLEHVTPLVLTVAGNKVVSYSIAGAPVAIGYANITPTTLSFGDRDHFSLVLTRTGDTTAAAKAHGRTGDGSGVFVKQ